MGENLKSGLLLIFRFVYFQWNLHEINSSDGGSDIISDTFNLMKVPSKLKKAIWSICMSENTYLQIRKEAFSIKFERAIREG